MQRNMHFFACTVIRMLTFDRGIRIEGLHTGKKSLIMKN